MSTDCTQDETPPTAEDQVVQQLVQHQACVYRYILALIGNYSDAEDLLQQTMLTVWEKRDSRETDDLLPWALTIAKNHVCNHVRKAARRGGAQGLSEANMERIAAAREKHLEESNYRQQALDECLRRLPAEQRELVEDYYDFQLSTEQIAKKLKKSVDAFYKSLQRTRRTLFDCINNKLAAGELG